MGYTHYWDRPETLENFKAYAADVRKLIKAVSDPSYRKYYGGEPLVIVNGCGDVGSKPTVTAKLVSFNGAGELGHETFHVPETMTLRDYDRETSKSVIVLDKQTGRTVFYGEHYFNFCKTARKPYDLLVVASLIALKHHCPTCVVSSDGKVKDWEDGLKLCRSVLGYGEIPFVDEAEVEVEVAEAVC